MTGDQQDGGVRVPRVYTRRGQVGRPPKQAPTSPARDRLSRIEFAYTVVRKLVAPGAHVAVVDCDGKPALIERGDRLYGVWTRDHPLVGVYREGVSVDQIAADLEAAGL